MRPGDVRRHDGASTTVAKPPCAKPPCVKRKPVRDAVAKLLRVKTIVTVTVMTVWAVLTLGGGAIPESVNIIASTVVAFYFGTQYESGRGER